MGREARHKTSSHTRWMPLSLPPLSLLPLSFVASLFLSLPLYLVVSISLPPSAPSLSVSHTLLLSRCFSLSLVPSLSRFSQSMSLSLASLPPSLSFVVSLTDSISLAKCRPLFLSLH